MFLNKSDEKMITCKHCGEIKHKLSKRATLCYECLIKHKQNIGYQKPKPSFHFKWLFMLAELFKSRKKKEKINVREELEYECKNNITMSSR